MIHTLESVQYIYMIQVQKKRHFTLEIEDLNNTPILL